MKAVVRTALAARSGLGDSSSARLVAPLIIGAALGARSAPGADYCFDQRVSRGVAVVRLRRARGPERCRSAAFRARVASRG